MKISTKKTIQRWIALFTLLLFMLHNITMAVQPGQLQVKTVSFEHATLCLPKSTLALALVENYSHIPLNKLLPYLFSDFEDTKSTRHFAATAIMHLLLSRPTFSHKGYLTRFKEWGTGSPTYHIYFPYLSQFKELIETLTPWYGSVQTADIIVWVLLSSQEYLTNREQYQDIDLLISNIVDIKNQKTCCDIRSYIELSLVVKKNKKAIQIELTH